MFKKNGLWPTQERQGTAAKMPEVFQERVEVGTDGTHADVLKTPKSWGTLESRLTEEHGPPPFPGAVFDPTSHRWKNPRTGEDHPADENHHHNEHEAAAVAHQSLTANVKAQFAAVRSALESKLKQSAGGRVVLSMGKGGVWLFHQIEHRLLFAMKKTQEISLEAAKERGLPDEKVPALKRALYWADMLGGYATGAAGLAVGGVLGGKIGAVMPSASVLYLAYSTAKDPPATWAAKRVVAMTFAKTTQTESTQPDFTVTPELAGLLADRIKAAVDPDWYLALPSAAIASTEGDVQKAIDLVDAAIAEQPTTPNEGQ